MYELIRNNIEIARSKLTEKIEVSLDCWNWIGNKSSSGYGIYTLFGKSCSAARAAYFIYRGDICKGNVIDHLCRNRACANPSHLESVTHAENMRRALPFRNEYGEEFCKRGHFLSRKRNRPEGGRYCNECVTINKRLWRQRTGRD